ncbi:MAG: hypothetical protein K0U93_06125 [Gammaproteobacteria bacterium]|nr:hypothetical protein [Gammaproteobacteria bacterium]
MFDNPARDGVTDTKFLRLLEVASNSGTYYFTENQLYFEYCKRILKGHKVAAIVAGSFLIVTAVLFLIGGEHEPEWLGVAVWFAAAATVIAGVTAISRWSRRNDSRSRFDGILTRWRKAGDGKSLDFLLDTPRLGDPPPSWPERDIYDYGVERIIVVERDLMVDLFVLNGLHTQERALVVSETGYPSYLWPKAKEMIAANPAIPVILLHDSTAAGLDMAQRVARLDLGASAVKDVGIFPDDIKQLKRLTPTNPARSGFAVALDLLPYAMMATGISAAIVSASTMGEVLGKTDPNTRESDFG